MWKYYNVILFWYNVNTKRHNITLQTLTFSNSELKIKSRNKTSYQSTFKFSVKYGWWLIQNNYPFPNNPSTNIKLSKIQLHKIWQSGRIFGRPLRTLLKSGLLLMKNVLKPLDKRVLIPLRLTAVASSTDAAI